MAEESQQPKPAADTDSLIEKLKAILKGAEDDPTMRIWESVDSSYKLIDQFKKLGIFTPRPPLRKAVRKLAEIGGVYPVPNLAVVACTGAWKTMIEEANKKELSREEFKQACRLAYCESLPKLSTRDDVTDFIACVVHGMALDIIPDTHGTRLLYGAQVACSALPVRKKRIKRAKKALNGTPAPPETSTESAA